MLPSVPQAVTLEINADIAELVSFLLWLLLPLCNPDSCRAWFLIALASAVQRCARLKELMCDEVQLLTCTHLCAELRALPG